MKINISSTMLYVHGIFLKDRITARTNIID